MKNFLFYLLLLAFVSTKFYSCIDRNYDLGDLSSPEISLTPSLGLPIGHIRHTAEEVLYRIDPEDLRITACGDTLYLFRERELFLESRNTVTIPQNLVISSGILPASSASASYPFPGGAIDLMSSLAPTPTSVSSLERLTLGENSTLRLTVSGLPTGVVLTLIPPTGLTLQNSPPVGNGTVYFSVQAGSDLVDGEIFRYQLSSAILAGQVNVTLEFTNTDATVVWGNLGNSEFEEGGEPVDLSFFNDFAEGSGLIWRYPIINAVVHNYMGSTANYTFFADFIRARGTDIAGNPAYVYLTFNGSHQSPGFHVPAAPAPFEFSVSQHIFTREHGGTHNLLNDLHRLENIEYRFHGYGNDETRFHLTDPNRHVKIYFGAKLPLIFDPGSILIHNDTIHLDWSAEDTFGIELAILRLRVENGFPAHSQLTVRFLDETGTEVQVLPTGNYKVSSAQVSSEGRAIASTHYAIDIELDLDGWNALRDDVYKIVIHSEFRNNDNRAHFTAGDIFGVKLDLFVRGTIYF